ncbi:TetR/AcrR family transcriptional regulator [Phenylobacterium sp. Root700]|uniref:TetR/AcrR family transcriptional regulator n=1 Tax=Phenylobacterium sp. Root700 TaxID=1736591 RepID=UPI00070060EC|nr:TetR/AcrR family transcriptional regulator [Phenylobacterium sp. Root700]KRB40967.1 hypothetical protein ASE02_06240 [Phenylobacterium sp. Root700]
MRCSPGQKETTRTRLLRETAESISARGVAAALGGVSAAAGVTHGGFYAHFRSRDDLVAAGAREMFSPRDAAMLPATSDGRRNLAVYVDFDLSRDRRTATCPVPLLAGEAERFADAARSNFAQGVARLTTAIRPQLAHARRSAPDEEAHSVLAELVGALARAEPDPGLSGASLEHSRLATRRGLDLDQAAAADDEGPSG